MGVCVLSVTVGSGEVARGRALYDLVCFGLTSTCTAAAALCEKGP